MIKITPAEYLYLDSPLWSDAEDMMRATLQTLCFKNVLAAEEKSTLLNENDRRNVLRLYLRTGTAYAGYKTNSRAEKFLMEAFIEQPEMRFYELRNYVLRELEKDTSRFKEDHVCKDLKEKGLLNYSLFLSRQGKMARKDLSDRLKMINDHDENLSLPLTPIVKMELAELGANVILMNKEIINTLTDLVPGLDAMMLIVGPHASFQVYRPTESLTTGGFSSGGGFYSGGWGGGSGGGFGGGGFGGGGASGSW